MDIELKIDKKYSNSKIVIYASQVNEEISNIIDSISNISRKKLKTYKDDKLFILPQSEIESIYSENGKIYVRSNDDIYTIKDRLYKLETFLDKNTFIRISNSEIINFSKVKNIDFKILGTLIINFKSGNKAYASRRYIPKIKSFFNDKEVNDKYMSKHPYKTVFAFLLTILSIILAILLNTTKVFSGNISTINIIVLLVLYAICVISFLIKCILESTIIKKINVKIKDLQ